MRTLIGNLLFLAALLSSLVVALESDFKYNVLHFGAVGDGNSDDTTAFMKTWEATCKSSSSSVTMLVPSEKTFFIQPVSFSGPCKSKSVTIEINGEIIAPIEPSEWKFNGNNNKTWIDIRNVDHLFVQGNGTIHGRGQKWWKLPVHNGPGALEISSSRHLQVSGLNFKDNPRMHLILSFTTSASVTNITINSPGDSPNTDGIHVTHTKHAIIDSCQVDTGAECIKISSGTSDLRIRNMLCGLGQGISIGSLGKDGAEETVENVRVSDVVFRKSRYGAWIKTWQGGRGHVKHITFERILLQEADNPINIDQFYCQNGICRIEESAVEISDITYKQIIGTAHNMTAVKLTCSDTVPCRDINFEDIYILSHDEKNAVANCSSVHGKLQGKTVPNLESCLS